jgi:hypothetical protein
VEGVVDGNNRGMHMLTLNLIGLAFIAFIVFALLMAIFAWPFAKLWYYLNEVQDETTNDSGDLLCSGDSNGWD